MAVSTGAAILGAAGIGAASGLIGGSRQASGMEAAAQTGAAATAASIASQERMFNKMLSLQKPYMQAGQAALPGLQAGLGEAGAPALARLAEMAPLGDIEASPLYKWRLQQEQEAMNKQLAARGMYGSGAGLEALGDITSRLGAEETANQYDRLTNLYNMQYGRALNLANIGRGAATTAGQGAMQAGAGIAGTQMAGGANLANLQALGGQQQAQMWGSLGALPMQALGAYQTSQFLDKMG